MLLKITYSIICLLYTSAIVHGTTITEVHFHEVGAADAVADIIGASYLFYELGMDNKTVYGMPVALGGGRIKSKMCIRDRL